MRCDGITVRVLRAHSPEAEIWLARQTVLCQHVHSLSLPPSLPPAPWQLKQNKYPCIALHTQVVLLSLSHSSTIEMATFDDQNVCTECDKCVCPCLSGKVNNTSAGVLNTHLTGKQVSSATSQREELGQHTPQAF